jgi:hypothetical protein
MKEKPKRGDSTRTDSIIGGLIGIVLVGGLIAFLSQNSLVCACFGLPGLVLVGGLLITQLPGSLRAPRTDDETASS